MKSDGAKERATFRLTLPGDRDGVVKALPVMDRAKRRKTKNLIGDIVGGEIGLSKV